MGESASHALIYSCDDHPRHLSPARGPLDEPTRREALAGRVLAQRRRPAKNAGGISHPQEWLNWGFEESDWADGIACLVQEREYQRGWFACREIQKGFASASCGKSPAPIRGSVETAEEPSSDRSVVLARRSEACPYSPPPRPVAKVGPRLGIEHSEQGTLNARAAPCRPWG